ncbi:MAG TPA: Zn-dependent protease, partial [Xanthobacteraceae bacterium]|nr:Zn-dependent protease [Xanthobacteraceae bacterium]
MPNGSTARTNAIAWRTREAPSLEAFEILAEDAFARLPESFRALCGGVVLRVEDFPEDDVLEELEAESPFDLL